MKKIVKKDLDELRTWSELVSEEEMRMSLAMGPLYQTNGYLIGSYGSDDNIYIYIDDLNIVKLSEAPESYIMSVLTSFVYSQTGYSGAISLTGLSGTTGILYTNGIIDKMLFNLGKIRMGDLDDRFDLQSALYHESVHLGQNYPGTNTILIAQNEDAAYSQQVNNAAYSLTSAAFKFATAQAWYNECHLLSKYTGKTLVDFLEMCQ